MSNKDETLLGEELRELQNRFTYHAPKPEQVAKYEAIRKNALQFATFIKLTTPVSREQSIALTHIEEAVYNANAAIARHS